MRKLLALARFGALALAAVALTACSTVNGALGGDAEPSTSPRWAVTKAVNTIEPVMDELSLLIAAGGISDNVADDIVQYGPDVADLVSAYFDGAEACVVIGAQLVTDPAAGRECRRATLLTLYDSIDQKVLAWAIKTGINTKEGQTIVAARLVLSAVPRPVAGGPFPGYRDEPDVPLADFQAMRVKVRGSFETLLAAAEARLKK